MKVSQVLVGAGRPGTTITSIVATIMTQQANGSLTPGSDLTLASAATFAGTIEEMEFEQEFEGEEVGLLAVECADETSGAKRTVCSVTELLSYKTGNTVTGTKNGNLLQQIFNNSVVHNDGDSPGGRIALFKVRRANRQFELTVKLKNYREVYRNGICRGVLTCTVHDPAFMAWAHPYISTYA